MNVRSGLKKETCNLEFRSFGCSNNLSLHISNVTPIEMKPNSVEITLSRNVQVSKAKPSIKNDLNTKVTKPKRYWGNKENQLAFFDSFYRQFAFNSMEDWYMIKNKQIRGNGGTRILSIYNDSIKKALMAIYPNYQWNLQRFSNSRDKFSSFKGKTLVSTIKTQFFIQKKEDWYRISTTQLNSLINNGNWNKCIGKIYSILKSNYCDEKWNERNFNARLKKTEQRWLFVCISKLFPKLIIYEDYFHPSIKFRSDCSITFDLFIPSFNLSIEYQGQQHYDDYSSRSFGQLEVYQHRDSQKYQLCIDNHIHPILVPYWWDKNLHSLQSTLSNSFLAMDYSIR